MITFKMEGLEETVHNLGELPKATRRNVLRRVLTNAGEPVADQAASIAPQMTGRLAFSIGFAISSRPRSSQPPRSGRR